MTTLAEFMIIASAENRPPLLEKSLTKKYEELSATEKIQADCDYKDTNIVLQGLPPDVYAIVNHHKVAKEIWDRFKLLIQGTKLSLQEKEYKLYDEFENFTFVKGLNVHVFNQGDDPISFLNKAMSFLTAVTSSSVVSDKHVASPVFDNEKTFILEEVSQSKMLAKQNDPISKEKKVNTSPINYAELNRLSKDLEYLENNDLKAQLQAKDTTNCKLKEQIKTMRENDKEEKVKHEMDEIETINIELEHSMAEVIFENKRLHKEIEHLKKIFKDHFDSVKRTCTLSKEHDNSLIAQLNSKSMENADLKRQIPDKVFVIISLKSDLRKLKGKEVENTSQIPIATVVAPSMFKLDLNPLAPRLLLNRKARIYYLKNTQEQADILQGTVKQAKAKQPLDNALDLACKHAT
nr:hypothetical protein [Tanacetum cinerariifolium]